MAVKKVTVAGKAAVDPKRGEVTGMTGDIEIQKTQSEMLPVALTPEELADYADELKQALAIQRETKAKHAAAKEDMKEEKEAADAAVDQMVKLVSDRAEDRPVDVEFVVDWRTQTVSRIRKDTGEVLSTRPVDDADRQGRMA